MNILVIGNGFDLAHGLPTSYPDFLGFCRMIENVYSNVKSRNADSVWDGMKIELKDDINTERLKMKFLELYSISVTEDNEEVGICIKTNTVYDEVYMNISNNFWVEYFLQNPMYQRDNWIDFESEMSMIIKAVDDSMDVPENDPSTLNDVVFEVGNEFVEEYFSKYDATNDCIDESIELGLENITYKVVRDKLYRDSNRLIRALEIYLVEYVGKIECKCFSPDIEQISRTITGKDSVIISKVLSFNYSNTYERIYFPRNNIEEHIDYIHGKANIENTILTNNMVLGIDEYLPEERKNKEVEFISFKKFYQRIYKETGCKYKNWIDDIKYEYLEYLQKREEANNRSKIHWREGISSVLDSLVTSTLLRTDCNIHNLYIFGHSLDVTDGDVLRDLILNDNVHTTIFYYNKDAMGQQIANLVRVIGQDELIRRTGGSTRTIEFKQQAELVEKNNEKYV